MPAQNLSEASTCWPPSLNSPSSHPVKTELPVYLCVATTINEFPEGRVWILHCSNFFHYMHSSGNDKQSLWLAELVDFAPWVLHRAESAPLCLWGRHPGKGGTTVLFPSARPTAAWRSSLSEVTQRIRPIPFYIRAKLNYRIRPIPFYVRAKLNHSSKRNTNRIYKLNLSITFTSLLCLSFFFFSLEKKSEVGETGLY